MEKIIITEGDIDKVHQHLDADPDAGLRIMTTFANEQPHMAAWLLGDEFEILTKDEQDLLYFLATCMYAAVKDKVETVPEINGDDLRNAEERNWEIMEGVKAKRFEDRISILFEDSDQEDLLAFVEDSIAEDEEDGDDIVTAVGREAIFIALKSFIDSCPVLK